MKDIKIGNFTISQDGPAFLVAELSANHNQKLQLALDTVKAARDAGADAIKLQHYTPDTITIDSDNKYFQITQGTLWDGTTLYRLFEGAYMPWEWTEDIMKVADECGLICFSSPFDFSAVDLLEQFDVPAYKVASFEITDIPLIDYIARKGKPVIISTGIATLADIELAVNTCKAAGNDQVMLLKCTSAYPAPLELVNLRTIPNMSNTFDCHVGLSDHTLGTSVPIAAVTLGARMVEKHFILNRSLGGPDSAFSLDVADFSQMVQSVRDIEKALGKVSYEKSEKSIKAREHSRSLFVVKDIKAGEELTEENIRSIRPGYGMHPKNLSKIIGKKAATDLSKGTPLFWDLVD